MKNGTYDDLSNEKYHGNKTHFSSSNLKLALRDVRKFYKECILGEKEFKDSPALRLGSYVHSLILEPDKTDDEFLVFMGSSRSKAYKEAAEQNKDKIIIGNLDALLAKSMFNKFKETEAADKLISDGVAEKSIFTELEGIPIKVRCDWLRKDRKIVDVKTSSGSVGISGAIKAILNFDYDLSAALYVDAMNKITKKKDHEFYFVFIGKDPVDVAIYKASEQMLENGRRKYKKALNIIKRGMETGSYFKEGIVELDIPESRRFD